MEETRQRPVAHAAGIPRAVALGAAEGGATGADGRRDDQRTAGGAEETQTEMLHPRMLALLILGRAEHPPCRAFRGKSVS